MRIRRRIEQLFERSPEAKQQRCAQAELFSYTLGCPAAAPSAASVNYSTRLHTSTLVPCRQAQQCQSAHRCCSTSHMASTAEADLISPLGHKKKTCSGTPPCSCHCGLTEGKVTRRRGRTQALQRGAGSGGDLSCGPRLQSGSIRPGIAPTEDSYNTSVQLLLPKDTES